MKSNQNIRLFFSQKKKSSNFSQTPVIGSRHREKPTCMRSPGTAYHLPSIIPTMKHSGANILPWGCFKQEDKRPARAQGRDKWRNVLIYTELTENLIEHSQDWCQSFTSPQKKMTLNTPREFRSHLEMSVSGQPEL